MRHVSFGCLLGGLLVVCGCGRPAHDRYNVSGVVTFRGSPVPAGTVIVIPDLSARNDGPQGIAEIKDGRYDTRALGKGGPGGPVVVRIDGYDGRATPDLPYGKPLFATYEVKVELPREDTRRDFDVPPEAADRLPKGEAGGI